ncbi:MAG: DMT family transporter [Candidatus Marinimicrobia bacterium]|nr:DMT family transporter [Candidatus Neomarinimicrobiota bacterium]
MFDAMNNRVYIILVFGLLGVSFGAPLARFLPELAALTIAFWRMAGAATLLWSHGGFQKQNPLDKKQYAAIIVAGIFLALHFAFFYSAVKITSIANATLFATMAPLFTLIYERFVLKQKLAFGAMIGLWIAISGAVIVQGAGFEWGAEETTGNLYALASSVFMAVVLIIAQGVRTNITNILYTRWLYLIAAATLAIMTISLGIDLRFQMADTKWLLGLIILPTLIGHNSMSYAVKYLRPTIVGSMPFGEPILASILAWLFFGEIVGWNVIFGGAITLSGLILLTLKRDRRRV